MEKGEWMGRIMSRGGGGHGQVLNITNCLGQTPADRYAQFSRDAANILF